MTHSQLFTTIKLVITGIDPVPVKINLVSIIIYRQDMTTTPEEVDTMVIQQVADVRSKKVLAVADDTDVFGVAYLFLLQRRYTSTSVLMVHPFMVAQTQGILDGHK